VGERSGAPYPGQVYDWWNEADPPRVLTLIGTYSVWTINRTVIRHGVDGASPSLISQGNRLSEVLLLLIDREAACNIQDVSQLLEKTMRRRTGTHVHEKNETTDNGWTKNHQNGKHP
jgi:hypothetical protein